MNSLGVFYDVNLKKSNDLMEVFEHAMSKTNDLVETMDNYNTHKNYQIKANDINKNDISNSNSNSNSYISNISVRKNNKFRTYNQKALSKPTLRPLKNNQYYFRKREPYNYQKEYENELISQIEKLFNPSSQINGKKEEIGMLSFLTPLINSNIEEKNKKFYAGKKFLNKAKESEKTNEKELLDNETKSLLSKESTEKNGYNNRMKYKISKRHSFKRKENDSNISLNYKRPMKRVSSNQRDAMERNKYDIPEINELKKNRYFSRTKNNFRNYIVARDVSSKKKKKDSNIDNLINKLKQHYS